MTGVAGLAGCAPSAEMRGDQAVRARDYARATSAYKDALRDETLFEYERVRLEEKLRDIGGKKVLGDLATTSQIGAPRARLLALAAKRKEGSSYGVDQKVDLAVLSEMKRAALEAWPEVETFAEKKHFYPAILAGEQVLGALGSGSELDARYDDLLRRARAHHEDKRKDAAGQPGAELLHARMVQRAGGSSTSTDDADRLSLLTWNVVVAPSGTCDAVAREIGATLPKRVGRPIDVELQIASCPATKNATQSSETYTYEVQIPYEATETFTVYKTVSVTKTRPEQVCGPATTYTTGPGYGGGTYTKRDCQTQQVSYTETQQVPEQQTRVVTRYRSESRTGTRNITKLLYAASVNGAARVAYDGRTESLALGGSKELSDKIESDHNGTRGPNSSINERRALEEARTIASQPLEDLGRRVQSHRAKELEAQAQSAPSPTAKESFYVLAVRANGSLSEDAKKTFAAAYGLSPEDLRSVLAGGAPVRPSSAASAASGASATIGTNPATQSGRDRAREEKKDRGRTGGIDPSTALIGLEHVSTEALGTVSSRAMVGVSLGLSVTGLERVQSSNWGFHFHDELFFRGSIGGRTSAPATYASGEEDGSFAYQVTAEYAAMLGYRALPFGIFAGAKTGARYGQIGPVAMSGLALPLAARIEVRLGGPAVLTAQIYGIKTALDQETRGGDLSIPLGRGSLQIRARVEQWILETTVPGTSLLEEVDIGRFQSTAASAELGTTF